MLKKVYILPITIVFLLGVVFAISSLKDTTSGVVINKDLKGTIYLSLVPNNLTSPQGMYTFDFNSKELKPFFVDFETLSSNSNGDFSGDGSMIVFVLKNPGSLFGQIHTMNSDKTEVKQITSSEFSKINPKWNPNKDLIAYSVHPGIVKLADDHNVDN